MTSQSLCSREDSFLATGTGCTERGGERGQNRTRFRAPRERHRQAHHVQEVDGSFEGTPGPGAWRVLAFLQHPPPVARAVLLGLGTCCQGLRNQRCRENEKVASG